MIEDYKANAADLLHNPDDAVALTNRFVMLATNSKRTAAHLAVMRRAAALASDQFEAVFNLASAENRAGHFNAALETFRRSLVLAPANRVADVIYNIGMCWHDLEEFDRALEWYEKALERNGDDLEIRQAHAVARLAAGRLADGLFDFECRWHRPNRKPIARAGIPRWIGETLTGRRLIVCHEQGFGDSIQFSRVIPRLAGLAAEVVWSGPEVLNGLMADNFGVATIGEDGPFDADFYCSPMSAFGALGLGYSDVSGEPYMRSGAMHLPARGKLRVGLSWRGSPGYARDADRSMGLEDLCPLIEVPGLAFYSLQVRPAGKEISNLGLDGLIADMSHLLNDWRDTARAISAMDVVVTVDTANGHLAGALGKPVALLLNRNSCWRWRRDQSLTPWYRSTRLFRQSVQHDWTDPVMRVRDYLKGLM